MSISVATRAHRILSHVPGFRFAVPLQIVNIGGIPLETIIGFYENVAGEVDETVVFSEEALHVFQNNTWRTLPYSELVSVQSPENKTTVDGLMLERIKSEPFFLPIRGSRGKFRDVFPMLRFLNRVLEDRQAST